MQKKYWLCLFSVLLLNGCGNQVAKLQKYTIDDEDAQCLLVVKINNFDYLDLKRLRGTDGQNSSKEQVIEKKSIATASISDEEKQTDRYDLKQLFNKNKANKKTALAFPKSEYRILRPNAFFLPFSYAHTIYHIQPGTYYISYVAIESQAGVYYSEAPGLNNAGTIAYGAFTIKPGEVLYLGDLECQWHSSNKIKKFQVVDKLTTVKKDLYSAGLTELSEKITNAKFYTSGTNINAIN